MKEDYFNLILRNNGYYYYYVYDKYGRRVYRSTGEKRKGKAMEIAIERSRTGELLEPKVSKHIKFGEYAKDFWNYNTWPIIQDYILRGRHYSMLAAKINNSATENVLIDDFGNYYLEELTTSMLQKWLVNIPKKRKVSPKTANDYMLNLRQILGQAVSDGYIEKNPALEVKRLAKETHGKGTFSKEQIKLLFATNWPSMPAYAGCLLAAKTGMRLGEIRALTVEQIHDDYIDVNASWAEGGEGRKTTKSGHSRIVPVENELITLLRQVAPRPTGLVFTFDGVEPCNKRFFNDRLKERMEACKIPEKDENGLKLSFHSFRYFFNTRLIINNISGEKIRATIGHESASMTEHYTRLSSKDLDEIRKIQKEIC